MGTIFTTGIGLYLIIKSAKRMYETEMNLGSWLMMLLGISFLFRLGLFSRIAFSLINIAVFIIIVSFIIGLFTKKKENSHYKNSYKSSYKYSNFSTRDNSTTNKQSDNSDANDPFSYRQKTQGKDFVDVEYEDWEPESEKKKYMTK